MDSANASTTYGSVWEIHEILGTPYNNIRGPVSSTALADEEVQLPNANQPAGGVEMAPRP